jgi:hypothetical protein
MKPRRIASNIAKLPAHLRDEAASLTCETITRLRTPIPIPTSEGNDENVPQALFPSRSGGGLFLFATQADAGSAIGPMTNPGGKYVHYGRTNPGLKHVYRGYGSTFHTNPGLKYVYPGYSAWRPGR